MTVDAVTINARDLSSAITLRIHGVRVMRRRWWWAAQIMRLAAVVAGCEIELTTSDGAGKGR